MHILNLYCLFGLSYTGRRIHGEFWTYYSHHSHNFDEYTHACKDVNSAARARKQHHAAEKRAASKSSRIASIKSEDRSIKAAERIHLLESPVHDRLDNFVQPCYHRDLLGEDQRKMYRDLPEDNWQWSTVFQGLSLNGREHKEPIKNYL